MIDPIVGGALVSGGASLLGNILGFGSNRSTNKTNLKIAQMNNEFNERMLQKQMDYNTEMWNKENEYNTASAQKERLEDAGLNPYRVMTGQNSGVASSAGGITPPTAQNVVMQSYNPDFSGIGAAAENLIRFKEQQRLNDANIDHVNADAQLKRVQQMTTLMDAYANAETSKARASLDRTINETQKMMQGVNYRNAEQDYQQKLVNNLIMSKELASFDDKLKVSLSEQLSRTLLNQEQAKLTKQQRIHEIQKMIETTARTTGVKISNDVAKRSANAIVDKYYNDEYWSRYSSNPWQMGQEVVQTRGASYKR